LLVVCHAIAIHIPNQLSIRQVQIKECNREARESYSRDAQPSTLFSRAEIWLRSMLMLKCYEKKSIIP